MREDHSNASIMKAAESKFSDSGGKMTTDRVKQNTAGQKLYHCDSMCERTNIIVGDDTNRGWKVCLHELCVQGSSEESKMTCQGKMGGEKSEIGVLWKPSMG